MPLITTQNAFASTLKKDDVVPDVIDLFPVNAVLDITYGPNKDVKYGNELGVSETQKLPKISAAVTKFPADPTYTLVVTDPDAPRRGDPKWSEFAHYVVTDIKLDSSKAGEPQELDLSKAHELLSYMGPGPPPKTGLHRYVFILFEGSSTKAPTDRPNWGLGKPGAGVREWLKDQSLTPVGLNFFIAQNEESK